MVDDVNVGDLPDEMQKYVKTRTYIDVKDMEMFRKNFCTQCLRNQSRNTKLILLINIIPMFPLCLTECLNTEKTDFNVEMLKHLV